MPAYNEDIKQFLLDYFAVEDEAAKRAREDAPRFGLPDISIDAEEGRFLMLLAAATGAKNAVEIGTLGGYSAIWIARGLVENGILTSIDLNPRHTQIAERHIKAAGLEEKVTLLTGDAKEVLEEISVNGPFDFVFIDADKDGYPAYYDWAVRNVRAGGVILAHNAFRGGRILDKANEDGNGMFNFLQMAAADNRVRASIYPGGDGTFLAVKNP